MNDVRIAIIGLGLIGGSIGLALRQTSDPPKLVGYTRSESTAERALARGAVDRVEPSLAAAVREANLVIIAVPIQTAKGVMAEIGPHLTSGSVVTDVGSTKVAILKWAQEFLAEDVDFVGGHPMAGKETSGIDVAEPGLFQGCTYCIVPGIGASQKSIDRVTSLARDVGGRPLMLSAAEHDYLVAGISHLPFSLACALVTATMGSSRWPEMSVLAATGFKDTSRLASQHPLMTRDICLTNKGNIITWIDQFAKELMRFRALLEEESPELEEILTLAHQMREEWLQGDGKRS